jgi:hypothetical protein
MILSRQAKINLYHSLPSQKKLRVSQIVGRGCQMGEGFGSIFNKIVKFLGHPTVQKITKPILTEIVLPKVQDMIKKKFSGSGMRLPGAGLRIAGEKCNCQRGRGRGRHIHHHTVLKRK